MSGKTGGNKAGKQSTTTHKLETSQDEDKSSPVEEIGMFNIDAVNTDTPGHAVDMEVETGAAVSEQVWNALPVTTPIQKTRVILKTYTSEKIKVIGKSNVTVGYNGKENNLEVYIVESHGPCLVGRDWLRLTGNVLILLATELN